MDLSGLGTLLTGAGAAAASLYAIFKDVRKTNRRGESGSERSSADEDGTEAVAELARRYLEEHHGNGDGSTPV